MRRRSFLLAVFLGFSCLVPTFPADADDHGKPQKEKKQDRDADERHDNGKHKGWDYDHDRIEPGRHYPHGRYEHVKQRYVVRAFDSRSRNIVLYDRSNWVVATYDVPHCRDWQWDRDEVYVYDDDHHPGWYLLFNARLGRYVHVEFAGIR